MNQTAVSVHVADCDLHVAMSPMMFTLVLCVSGLAQDTTRPTLYTKVRLSTALLDSWLDRG